MMTGRTYSGAAAAIALALVIVLPGSAYAQESSPSEPAPVWTTPLALGPTDASSVAARTGLVVAGGRAHFKDDYRGRPEQRPSPYRAGLYYSYDDGASWALGRIAGPEPQEVIAETPDLVAVPATGQRAYALFDTELWRSDDSAGTWAPVSQLPSAATTLDVLSDERVVAGLQTGGLVISSDMGATWATLGTGLPNRRVNEVLQLSATTILVATPSGLYRSTDGGATFAASNPSLATNGVEALGVAGLFERPSTPVFLAVPGTYYNSTHVYSSTDQGATWSLRGPIYSQNLFPRVQTGAFDMVWQANSARVFAGTSAGLFEAGAGSVQLWIRYDPEPGNRAVRDIAVYNTRTDQLREDAIFATVDRASVFRAALAQRGMTAPGWFDELDGGRICGGIVEHSGGDLIAACGRHVLRSSDRGATWRNSGNGLPYISAGISDTPYMPLAQTADGQLWTSGYHYGLYRSSTSGDIWNKQLNYPGVSADQIEPHPADAKILYVTGTSVNGGEAHVVWKTSDGGARWNKVFETPGYVYTVDVSKWDPQRVLVASFGSLGGLHLSQDGGATWTAASGIPTGSGYSMLRAIFSEADAGVAWAVQRQPDPGDGYIYALFRSDDAGLTWTEAGRLKGGAIIWRDALESSPWDADTLYLETVTEGLLVNRHGGETGLWEPLNSGLTGAYVDNLIFDRDDAGVMYATNGVMGSGAAAPSLWVHVGRDPAVATAP